MRAGSFTIATEEAPRGQQFRIFDAAHKCWNLVVLNMPDEERLAVAATIAALAIGTELMSDADDKKALDYLRKSAATLLPAVKERLSEAMKAGGH